MTAKSRSMFLCFPGLRCASCAPPALEQHGAATCRRSGDWARGGQGDRSAANFLGVLRVDSAAKVRSLARDLAVEERKQIRVGPERAELALRVRDRVGAAVRTLEDDGRHPLRQCRELLEVFFEIVLHVERHLRPGLASVLKDQERATHETGYASPRAL